MYACLLLCPAEEFSGTIKRQLREREREADDYNNESRGAFCRHTLRKSAIVPARRVKLLRAFNHFLFSSFFLVSFSPLFFPLSWHEIACLSCLFSCFSFRLQSSLVHRCGDIAANEFEDEGAVHKNKKTTVFLTCGRDLCAARRWLLYAKVSMQCTVNRETG